MKRTNQLFEGQHFLQDNLHMWINRFKEDFAVPYHAHDFIEYCYVAEGTGFHHIEQEVFPIHKGWLFVIPIGAAHVFRPATSEKGSKAPVVYNCLFDTHLAAQLSLVQEQPIQEHLLDIAHNPSAYFAVFDRDGSLESLMLKLHNEMTLQETGSQTMLYALLSQLIVTVYRLKGGKRETLISETANFNDIIYYLEQNYHQTLTLELLSSYAGWSSRHLQRLFHKYTGQAFGSFLQNLRMQKSCELLRTSTMKISVIAEHVGYRSIDSFNAAFKKIVGLTPTEYRKASIGISAAPRAKSAGFRQ